MYRNNQRARGSGRRNGTEAHFDDGDVFGAFGQVRFDGDRVELVGERAELRAGRDDRHVQDAFAGACEVHTGTE